MTIESDKNNGLSDFLLQVTQAGTFRDLASAYKIVSKDFEDIKKRDEKGRTKTFIQRYQELSEIADEILNKTNGRVPSAQDVAVFGEMVVLRDICLRRIDGFSK
ncbi:MAG: hypothetical protein KGD59_09790 [Candidatus Heimdallarchaeota archaeon]|nr:hypothetical protein [Candidatus Heimdallarchaeota archaeon]MBY8994827.1 hypothetical protein [Candidatus Heimdallarchaeota archaeon]